MSRGGRGGGRKGPDLSWDDDETPSTPASNRPEPTFPDIHLPVPKPITPSELSAVKSYLLFRDRIRNGPYYAVLDPSNLTDEKTGKVSKRAGFDPFNEQETFVAKYHQKKRTVPDLSGRTYALNYFPRELWATLDPKRTHPLWSNMPDADKQPRKRRRVLEPEPDDDEPARERPGSGSEPDADDDSDPLIGPQRKRRRDDKASKPAGQKRGLDAEDEYPDDAKDDNDDEEGGEGEDEPQDSEFSEDEENEGDDYNGEQYFDNGEDDGDDGGGDGDDAVF